MCGVDRDHVDAAGHKALDALLEIGADADRGASQQPAALIGGGIRVIFLLLDVLDRDQAFENAGVVDKRQLLDAMFLEQHKGFIERGAYRRSHQVLASHDLGYRPAVIGRRHEARVAVGQDAQQLAGLGVGHRHAADPKLLHDRFGIAQGRSRGQRDRVDDHARLRALDLLDLVGLLFGGQVAMDDAQTTFACQRDRQPGLGDRVHRGRDQRDVQLDAVGQPRAHVDLVGQGLTKPGDDKHVVEGQGLSCIEEFLVHSPRGLQKRPARPGGLCL